MNIPAPDHPWRVWNPYWLSKKAYPQKVYHGRVIPVEVKYNWFMHKETNEIVFFENGRSPESMGRDYKALKRR